MQAIVADWRKRSWWMNLIFYFCVYMTVVYMPFDIFYKPVAEDQEIWFGFTLTGWWAKATAPLHWLIYGLGAYGFWRMKSWMWPCAAVYAAQVVIAMFVFNLVHEYGRGYCGCNFRGPNDRFVASKRVFPGVFDRGWR